MDISSLQNISNEDSLFSSGWLNKIVQFGKDILSFISSRWIYIQFYAGFSTILVACFILAVCLIAKCLSFVIEVLKIKTMSIMNYMSSVTLRLADIFYDQLFETILEFVFVVKLRPHKRSARCTQVSLSRRAISLHWIYTRCIVHPQCALPFTLYNRTLRRSYLFLNGGRETNRDCCHVLPSLSDDFSDCSAHTRCICTILIAVILYAKRKLNPFKRLFFLIYSVCSILTISLSLISEKFPSHVKLLSILSLLIVIAAIITSVIFSICSMIGCRYDKPLECCRVCLNHSH